MKKGLDFTIGIHGKFHIPFGSNVLFDKSYPILHYVLKHLDWTSVGQKDFTNDWAFAHNLGIYQLEGNDSTLVFFDSESDPLSPGQIPENSNSINIWIQKNPAIAYDYIVTRNGIFNKNNEIIFQYLWLQDLIGGFEELKHNESVFFSANANIGSSGRFRKSYLVKYTKDLPPDFAFEKAIVEPIKNSFTNSIVHIGINNEFNLCEVKFLRQCNDSKMLLANLSIFTVVMYESHLKHGIGNSLSLLYNHFNKKEFTTMSFFEEIMQIPLFEYPNEIKNTIKNDLNEISCFMLNIQEIFSSKDCFLDRNKITPEQLFYFEKLLHLKKHIVQNCAIINKLFNLKYIPLYEDYFLIADLFNLRNEYYQYKDSKSFQFASFFYKMIIIKDIETSLRLEGYDFEVVKHQNYYIAIKTENNYTYKICENPVNSYFSQNKKIIDMIQNNHFKLFTKIDHSQQSSDKKINTYTLLAMFCQNTSFFQKAVLFLQKNYPELQFKPSYLMNRMRSFNNFNAIKICNIAHFLYEISQQKNKQDLIRFLWNYIIQYNISENDRNTIKKIINKNIEFPLFGTNFIKSHTNNFTNEIAVKELINLIPILESTNIKFICNYFSKFKGKQNCAYLLNHKDNPIVPFRLMRYYSMLFNNYDEYIKALYSNQNNYIGYDYESKYSTEFKQILTKLSFKTKYRLFVEDNSLLFNFNLFRDTILMIKEYQEKSKKKIAYKQFKKGIQLHDWLSEEIRKLNQQYIEFDINEYSYLNFSEENYSFIVIKNSHQLIELSTRFQNCIGSKYYFDSLMSKTGIIISVLKDNKEYAVLFADYQSLKIKEIKLQYNKHLESSEEDKIQLIILNKASEITN